MKLKKNRFIKTVAVLLVFTLLFQEIAGAEGFSFLTRKSDLQPQYFSGPINNPALQHESYIKFTLKYILEDVVRDIATCKRRIFDHRLVPGKGFVFDFREDPGNDRSGKRKENGNWVIPCALGDMGDIRQEHVYQWPYEAIVSEEKEVLHIRKKGEKRKDPAEAEPRPDIAEKPGTVRRRFLKSVLDNGRVLSVKEAAAILEAARSRDSRQAREWNVSAGVMAGIEQLRTYSRTTIADDLKGLADTGSVKSGGKRYYYSKKAFGSEEEVHTAVKDAEALNEHRDRTKEKTGPPKDIMPPGAADGGSGEAQRAPPLEREAQVHPAAKQSEIPHRKPRPELPPELGELLGTAAKVNGWEAPSYREGQVEAINGLKEGAPVELRTGGGKSLAFAGAAFSRYREKGERTLILTHEDALTAQAMEKDRMGEILSLSGVVTGFVLPDGAGDAAGVIYRDGQKKNVSAEEVYRECAIIYAKWDRIVHRYMAEEKGDEERVLSRDKYFALFDEADLMLVFGAATPAVISGGELEDRDVRLDIRRRIDSFVSGTLLADERAYYIPDGTREVYLSRSGERMTGRVLDEISAVSKAHADIIKALGETFVLDSLRAHLFYSEGVQYFISRDENGEPAGVIVRDEHTGAPMGTVSVDERTGKTLRKGMSFGEGLQQAIEIKAGVAGDNITPETYTAMSMTVEQFLKEGNIITDFAGASGTMEKERFESMYDKQVREIKGVSEKLISHGHSGSGTREEKWKALTERLRERIGNGQPLLIKAESDAETEELREFIETELAGEISRNGIMISVADGRSPADFSAKMARAGFANMITIVTNLAHRGIDIEVKGSRLDPDGTEGEKVPHVNGKIPGLHVISTYLDEAEAFEIQTRGRADRGKDEIQGSWEGLFSLDEKVFAEYKDLLSHQRAGLARAVANGDRENVERLIAETRELIVSQRSRTDERRRRYEGEVFGYQRRLLRILEVTSDEESFRGFLESIDAYDAVSAGTSSREELAEKLRELRLNIRSEVNRALERFQTEQQRTRSRISYLADLSQLGIRGVFTRLNVELITAVRLARNFNLKVRDIKDFMKTLIADSIGDAVSGVRPRRRWKLPRTNTVRMILSAAAVAGMAAVLCLWGVQPLLSRIVGPAVSFLGSYPFISAVAAAMLLIPSIYLRQAYSRKISRLDTTTVDFMRFTAGIGRGSGLKAFAGWAGTLVLQLLAGPGLYAGAGTLITAVAHPVILAGFEPVAVPVALTGIGAALLANLALIFMYKGQYSRVKHVTATRFQHGLDVAVRTIAVITGLLIAVQGGGGSAGATMLAAGAVAAAALVSGVVAARADGRYTKEKQGKRTFRRYYRELTPGRAGVLAGTAAAAGLVVLASLAGSGVLFTSAGSVLSAAIGVIGIGMILLQTVQARKLAREAAREGQDPLRAAVESFLPNTRNIMMYATAIPAVILNFSGIFTTAVFIAAVGIAVTLVYTYSVDLERWLGRPVSRAMTRMTGGTVMMAAAVTPMVVFPERAYNAQQDRIAFNDLMERSGMLGEAKIEAMKKQRIYSRELFRGFRTLSRNIDGVVDDIAGTTEAPYRKKPEKEESEGTRRTYGPVRAGPENRRKGRDESGDIGEEKPAEVRTDPAENDVKAESEELSGKGDVPGSKESAGEDDRDKERNERFEPVLPEVFTLLERVARMIRTGVSNTPSPEVTSEVGVTPDKEMSAGHQRIAAGSPVAITLVATHMEHRAPAGLPRQTGEKKKNKQDPVDFIHVRNISDDTIDLTEFEISDSGGERRLISECCGGGGLFLQSGEEIRILFSGNDIAEEDLRQLAGRMVIVPEGLSRKGETVTIYGPRGQAFARAETGVHGQDEMTVFEFSGEKPRGELGGAVREADPVELSGVSHDIRDFREPGTRKDSSEEPGGNVVPAPVRGKDTDPADAPLEEDPGVQDGPDTRSSSGQRIPGATAGRERPPLVDRTLRKDLMSYEEALRAYENLTGWGGIVPDEKGSVDTLKFALRSLLGQIASGRIKLTWHGFGRQNLAWKIHNSLKHHYRKRGVETDPGTAILIRAFNRKREPAALRELLGRYDALSVSAEDLFEKGGGKSISDILDVVMRDAYRIKQAENRLAEAEATKELAGSGRLFWDMEASYGAGGTSSSSPLLAEAEEAARENAADLLEARRELAEDKQALRNDQRQLAAARVELADDRAALRNDQQQLAEAEAELADDLAALANDQRQLEEAIEEGDEDRIEQELAEIAENEREIEEDRARITREEAEIAENEREIEEDLARIEQELGEIADDREEIRRGIERVQEGEARSEEDLERIRELRKPELRLRSTLGAVLFDADRSMDVEANEAGERERRIDVELARVRLMDRVIGLYTDIVTARRNTEILSDHLDSLRSLREKSSSFNFSAEETVTLDMRIASTENDLAEQTKRILDNKAELRYIMGLPDGYTFELDDSDHDPRRMAALLERSNVRMDRYLALVLAKKSEEIEFYHAKVPSNLFERLGMNVSAVWEEDILRRVLYDNLRDPSFLGVRAGVVIGDKRREKEAREAMLLYLKAIDEYKLIERMQYTMRARAKDTIQALDAGQKEQRAIADQARKRVQQLRARHEAGFGDLMDLIRAMEDARKARIDTERSFDLRVRAEVARAKSDGTTRMDLRKYDEKELEAILELMEHYEDHCLEGRFEKAARIWSGIRVYFPDLLMPMSKRQIENYTREIESFRENIDELTDEKRVSTDELALYIRDNLTVEQRRSLGELVKQFENGRGTLGNFLRGRVKSDEEMAVIIDRISAIVPVMDIPEDVEHDTREDIVNGELPVISSALDTAGYSIEGTSIADMFLVACERGRLGPEEKDVEIARNMARDDVKVFRPIVRVGATAGISGDIFDLGNIDSASFLNASGLSVSLVIPLNNPGKREKREAGKEFVLSSLIKLKLAERDLQVSIARQLVTMHSHMEKHRNLDSELRDIDRRIGSLRENPRATRVEIEDLRREKRAVMLQRKNVLLQLKIARNNLRDILGLEYSDIVMIDNITNNDIERILDTLRESLEGNFVISSTIDMVEKGSMVTVGPDNELAANNIPTGLTVAGRRTIKILAVRDEKDEYKGQLAIDRGRVISSDIKNIPENSHVSVTENGSLSVTGPDGESVQLGDIHAGDISLRYIISAVDGNGQNAGEMLIDYRTGDEALKIGIHRAERRGYALSSVAIIKEGDQFSLVISVSPFLVDGCPVFIYPRIPDSWLDWKGLGWFNLPGFLTGAHARQKRRKVLSRVAMQESRRQDLLMKRAERIAARQKQSGKKLYSLAKRKVDLSHKALERCEARIELLTAHRDSLDNANELDRLKADRIRLEGLKDRSENNLAVMRMLLSVLDISENATGGEAGSARTVSLDQADDRIGKRTEDAIARIDIAIAREMKKLSSFANMFDQQMDAGGYFSEREDGKYGGTAGIKVALEFRPEINREEIADLDVEDRKIRSGLSMENARKRIIQLYGAYAEAAVRVAEQEARIRTLSALGPSGEQAPAGSEEPGSARLELARAKMARMEAEEVFSLGMAELAILLQSETGVDIDLSRLTRKLVTSRDRDELEGLFRGAGKENDRTIRHFRNRKERARLEEESARWSVLPTLSAEASWYGGDDDPGYGFSAATRILGSGRAIRAELARLEQERYRAAELNRIREIRYEWDLADNELTVAMRQARMLGRAIKRTEERVRYVLNAKMADHALGGGTDIRQIRRLIDEYEGLRARYFKANIRMNIAYARAVHMLNNLRGIEHTAGLLEGLKSSTGMPSAPAGELKRSVAEDSGPSANERTGSAEAEAEEKKDSVLKLEAGDDKDPPDTAPEIDRGHGDEARDGNGLSVPGEQTGPAAAEAGEKDTSEGEDRSGRAPPRSGNMLPGEEVPASVSTPADTTGFFEGLRRDIGIIYRDLSGHEDDSRDNGAIVCDVDPIDGNGRYTIRWIREEGETVREGDPVVRFDTSFLERQRDAQLKLTGETERDIIEAREALREAEKRKEALRGRHEEAVNAAGVKARAGEEMMRRAEERERLSEANIELARKHVKRLKALKEKGLVSEFEYNEALEAEHAAVNAKLEAVEAGIRAERVRTEADARARVLEETLARDIAALDGIIANARSDIRSAKRKLELQNRKLDLLNRNIEACTLYAERDGMVVYSNVTGVYLLTIPLDPALQTVIGPGVSIAKGQEVVRIVDPDSRLFRPRSPERSTGSVIRSEVSTAQGSRQGSMGVPIREIVPEGSRVEKGDVVARMDDSVLKSLERRTEADLRASERRAAAAASRLASARRVRETYIEREYPALVRKAEARLSGARSVHEARKEEARSASERTAFLKERLAKAEELSKREMVSQTEIDSLRILCNSARMQEAAARSEMEDARVQEAAAEAYLEDIHAEHEMRKASVDREMGTAGEELRLAEKDVEVDRKRLEFYGEQIEKCVIRAGRSGTVSYLDDQNITLGGASLRPVLNELIVGESAIIPVGVPFARIKDSKPGEDPPVISAGVRSFLKSRREEQRPPGGSRVPVTCRIKPLRFYNMAGYGATLKYVAPDGGYVREGDKLVEFDATAFERERDLQQRLVNETELYIDSERQRLAEAEKLKKAAAGRYREDRKALLAGVRSGERMLAEAGKKMEAAEANVRLARQEVRRTDKLIKSSVASSADRLDALLGLNGAEKARERARAETAEARRVLTEARAGLDALKAAHFRETTALEDRIKRARDNIGAADKRGGRRKKRLELIEANIENCVIRAREAGRVEYSNQLNTTILGFRVNTVPRDVSIGPRITIPFGQEILAIDTSVRPGETAGNGSRDGDVTFVEADVSTAYDSGAGVIYPTIRKIYVEDGQNVRKGQLLAELETSILEDLRKEAEARLQGSERSVSNAASRLAGARKRYLEYVNEEYPSLLQRARSALREAEKAYNAGKKTRLSAEKIAGLRKEILETGTQLLDSDNASARQIEALTSAYNNARMEAYTASYEEAAALLRVDEARSALERVVHERSEKVAALEREMETARGRLRLAEENRSLDLERVEFYERQLDGCVIRAPASGRVVFMHSLPVNILGMPLKSVPKERVVGPGATVGPGPFMKITDDGIGGEADAGVYDPGTGNVSAGMPEGGTPVRCGIEPVTFGRRGEHGAMVLRIAPEGKVKKGQLLVRFDTSAQENLLTELSERLNDNRMLSLEAAGTIGSCDERIRILAAKMSILRELQSSMKQGGKDMAGHAGGIIELADDNVSLADKAVQRTVELMRNMLASRIEAGTRRIEAREERIIKNRAMRELAVAVLTGEEGENIFAVLKSRVEQELELLGGMMERARIDREAAQAEKEILLRKIGLIRENIEKADIYAREDGWILYAHDTGESFAGIPVTYSADPVYIGTGCVVKNGQPVMNFYRERPDAEIPAASGARDEGVAVVSDVRTGDSDRNGPRGGRILDVPLNDGDRVEKGDPVLILDPAELKEMKRKAEVRLEVSRRAAERYDSSRSEAEERLEAFLEGEYPARLKELNAALTEGRDLAAAVRKRISVAGTTADLREDEYRQLRKLRQRGIASLSEVESAGAEWNRALLRRERAEYELDSIAVSIAATEYAIRELVSEKDRREAALEAEIRLWGQKAAIADERVRLRERKVAFYGEQIANCVIRAPVSGVITYNEEVSYTFLVDHWVPRDIILTPGYEIPPGITVAEISDASSGSADQDSFFRHSPLGLMAFILLMAGLIRKTYEQIRAGLDTKYLEDPRIQGRPDRTKRLETGSGGTGQTASDSSAPSPDGEEAEADEDVPEDQVAEETRVVPVPAAERKEVRTDKDVPRDHKSEGVEEVIDGLNARLRGEFHRELPEEEIPRKYLLGKTDWTLSLDPTQINELFLTRRMKMRAYIAEARASKREHEGGETGGGDLAARSREEERGGAGNEGTTDPQGKDGPSEKDGSPERGDKDTQSGGKGPILGAMLLSMLLPLAGCIRGAVPGAENGGNLFGKAFSWYSSLSRSYPALEVLSFMVTAALIMIAISYLLVMGRDREKEDVSRIETFVRRPGLFIGAVLSLSILTFIPGIPPGSAWAQAAEIAKIIAVAAVCVTYPLSIAGTYIIGFFRKDVIFRFRVPFPTGIVKMRYNSVAMSVSEGTRRLFKWWAVLSSIAAFLVYALPHFIRPPSAQGPAVTLEYVYGWITHLYNEIAIIHPYVEFLRWGIIVLVISAFAETMVRRFTDLLRDDDSAVKRVVSKLLLLGVTGGIMCMASPFLPSFLSFPGGVTLTHVLWSGEIVAIFAGVIGLYFLIATYIMGLFSPRINRIYQVPPVINLVISRFRNNAPRLVALRRLTVFIASMLFIEFLLVTVSPSPLLLKVSEWYTSISMQNPALIAGAWISSTVFLTVVVESLLEMMKRVFPSMDRRPLDRAMKLLSFAGSAAAVSLLFIGFPSVSAWSQVFVWLEIFILGSIIIGMPMQIIGAFFLGIKARVLHIRGLVPFMAHVKTRIRELESHQSEAITKLLNIWKWLIALGAVLLYAAPRIFTPEVLDGGVHNSLLRLIYAKTVKWTVFLSNEYPFVNVIFWLGTVLLLAPVIEIAIKKVCPGKTGDEYISVRLARKVPALLIASSVLFLCGLLPLQAKVTGITLAVLGIVASAALEFALAIVVPERSARVRKVLGAASIVFIALGLTALVPAFPGAVSWAAFWPAAEVAALVIAVISVYFMISGFILGMFTPRINRVAQPLFNFFFLVTRMRSEIPPMKVVGNMFGSAVLMTALAYIFSNRSVPLAVCLAAGLIALALGAIYRAKKTRESFSEAGISPHRREEKFELYNINEEPREARDMLEAMGMVGDKFNPTKTYYYNHSLYLDTPGYKWKGFAHFISSPFLEIKRMLTMHPRLLTYFARENSYRDYRYKARIRWYGDRELITKIFDVRAAEDMDGEEFVEAMERAIPEGDDIRRRFRVIRENLPAESADYTAKQMKAKLLDLAGQTKADKGKIHLEIKNRLDTRMWKFETGAWEWAVPYIFALADGGGTVRMNGRDYIFRKTGETRDFFGFGRKRNDPVLFRVDRETGEKTVAERVQHTENGYRAYIDGQWLTFSESDIDREPDYNWLPEMYQGKPCRDDPGSRSGLKQFCSYIKQYGLVPSVQVSYERLEYVSAYGHKDMEDRKKELMERLVPLALEYRQRMRSGPDADHWRGIYMSPAGKYLRRILEEISPRYPDPEHPGEVPPEEIDRLANTVNIALEDIDYLRMTLDMNVRWRVCDDLHNPTLFTGLQDFRRTWPGRTILEVKYREEKAPRWVYDVVGELDRRREGKTMKDFPIRRQPAGKYCDSASVWLYRNLLEGTFRLRGLKEGFLRLLGLEKGYPVSANAPQWAGYGKSEFNDVFGIDHEEPYRGPHGIEPLGYGERKLSRKDSAEGTVTSGDAETGGISSDMSGGAAYDEVESAEEEEDTTGGRSPGDEEVDEDARGTAVQEPEEERDSGIENRAAAAADVPGEAVPEEVLEEIRYRILETSADEAFARAFADAVFSFYREDRQIVFAFDAYLGGGQSSRALELVEMVNELKADERYAGFLENIDVMRFDTTRGERGLRSLRERIGSGALVFSFAADTSQARDSLEELRNDPDHKLSFINEKEVWQLLSTEKVYYPLFEIVTITLARYIDEMNIEDIKEISGQIALRTKQENGALVFTILPSIRRFETNSELLRHYAMKRKMLLAA